MDISYGTQRLLVKDLVGEAVWVWLPGEDDSRGGPYIVAEPTDGRGFYLVNLQTGSLIEVEPDKAVQRAHCFIQMGPFLKTGE